MTQPVGDVPPAGSPGVLTPVVEVRWRGDELEATRREALAALLEPPRSLPSKLFYDEVGSQLFDRICELPEYYPTRTERALLASCSGDVAARTAATELVELGPGTAAKTRLLIDALRRGGTLSTYLPLDVSEELLRQVAAELAAEYPGLAVHGVVGDFMAHLEALPDPAAGGARLVAFLGGTIGNLHPDHEAPRFLAEVAATLLRPGDWLLLGTDLVKDPAVLEAAYDDSQGVTAEFNRNILRVANRLLAADFAPERFAHRAFWDADRRWIEMRLVSLVEQRVSIRSAEVAVTLAAGEEIRTEISAKYDAARIAALLSGSGLTLETTYTDPQRVFALTLARRA